MCYSQFNVAKFHKYMWEIQPEQDFYLTLGKLPGESLI